MSESFRTDDLASDQVSGAAKDAEGGQKEHAKSKGDLHEDCATLPASRIAGHNGRIKASRALMTVVQFWTLSRSTKFGGTRSCSRSLQLDMALLHVHPLPVHNRSFVRYSSLLPRPRSPKSILPVCNHTANCITFCTYFEAGLWVNLACDTRESSQIHQ